MHMFHDTGAMNNGHDLDHAAANSFSTAVKGASKADETLVSSDSDVSSARRCDLLRANTKVLTDGVLFFTVDTIETMSAAMADLMADLRAVDEGGDASTQGLRMPKWRCSQARRGRDPHAGRGPHAGFGALAHDPTARLLGAAHPSGSALGVLKMVPFLLLLFPDTATALVRDVELVASHSVELPAVGGAAAAVALHHGGLGVLTTWP